jgi:hypothetical protein
MLPLAEDKPEDLGNHQRAKTHDATFPHIQKILEYDGQSKCNQTNHFTGDVKASHRSE